jgi:hypothetical protein
MQKTLLFILLFSGLFFTTKAQKVAGVYKGYMEVDSPKNTINFELTLKEKKGKLSGYCYRLFVLRDTLYYNLLKVSARIKDDVLIIEDEYSVSNNFENNTRGIKTVFFFNLKDIQDTSTVLPGKWNTTAWRNYKSLTGQVQVIREKNYLTTELYKRLADKNLDQEMVFNDTEIGGQDVAVQGKKDKNKKQKDKSTDATTGIAKNEKDNNTNNTLNRGNDNEVKTEETSNPNPKQNKKPEEEPTTGNKTTSENKTSINRNQFSDSSNTDPRASTKKIDSITQNNNPLKEINTEFNTEDKLSKRATELVQTLTVFEDSITLVLYDNGEIDGDTVSVYVDNKLIINKMGLSSKAQKIKIAVPLGQTVQVMLYAETLGTIPPNTGLMLVSSGNQRYQVFFTSTLEKSASVLFRRQ